MFLLHVVPLYSPYSDGATQRRIASRLQLGGRLSPGQIETILGRVSGLLGGLVFHSTPATRLPFIHDALLAPPIPEFLARNRLGETLVTPIAEAISIPVPGEPLSFSFARLLFMHPLTISSSHRPSLYSHTFFLLPFLSLLCALNTFLSNLGHHLVYQLLRPRLQLVSDASPPARPPFSFALLFRLSHYFLPLSLSLHLPSYL